MSGRDEPEPMEKPANPFQPGKRLTRPELFAGRTPQLADGVDLLRQAKAGNVRHGLITGDRGIGKSSLSGQIQGIASGDERFTRTSEETNGQFRFLVAEHIATRGESVEDVVSGLLHAIDRSRGRAGGRFKLEWEFDLKLLKGRITERGRAPKDVTLGFLDVLEDLWADLEGQLDGALLVIDEVDRVVESEGLSTFFKVLTEGMSARGIENVGLMPVGTVGVKELLAAEHPSVGRVFEVIHVPRLEEEEAMDIVERALEGTGVTVEDDVNREIARLASGFPHPVHMIGAETYDVDVDMYLDLDDLEGGLASVVGEKWKEEFDASYIEAGSGKNREIVRAMAHHGSPDVPLSFICERMGVKQPEISSNINALMSRDVIVRVDRGVYRFKDALFGVYVEYLQILGDEPIERRPRKRTDRR